METMSPFVVRHFREKSIEASKAKFTWGLKTGRDLEGMVPGDYLGQRCEFGRGMKELYPVYKVLERIQSIKEPFNQLVILKKVI